MAEKEKEKKAKQKRPTAQKREIQNEKKRMRNRAYKAKAATAIRYLQSYIQTGKQQEAQVGLDSLYSIMDKGIKTGIFKKNQANRMKARMAKKLRAGR